MDNNCASCNAKLVIKYKINLRNFVILFLYLLVLFFSFTLLIRFSGWYGAMIFISIASTLGWFIRQFYQRYTQCTSCSAKEDINDSQ